GPRGSALFPYTTLFRSYGRRRLSYRTFAASGTEVVRLAYRPRRVVAGIVLEERTDLAGEGYVIQPVDGGDYVIRIRREHSRQIRDRKRTRLNSSHLVIS